jgi:hypothetical protein
VQELLVKFFAPPRFESVKMQKEQAAWLCEHMEGWTTGKDDTDTMVFGLFNRARRGDRATLTTLGEVLKFFTNPKVWVVEE